MTTRSGVRRVCRGAFAAALAAGRHPEAFEHLQRLFAPADPAHHWVMRWWALDNLVDAGILSPARRPNIEYPTWATVHGLAVLLRGPLSSLTEREKTRLEAQTLAFIGASVS